MTQSTEHPATIEAQSTAPIGEIDRRRFLQQSIMAAGSILAANSLAGAQDAAAQAPASEIVGWDANTLSGHIKAKQVSCREVMEAYLAQIDRLNPQVNAIVALQDR
ncbi:MAG: hypothetical protein NTU78_07955, partial [Alphaproteobacteria bacterium]|nr:hypothetical protein [Alphaproteobacteria bacterium]